MQVNINEIIASLLTYSKQTDAKYWHGLSNSQGMHKIMISKVCLTHATRETYILCCSAECLLVADVRIISL